MTIRFLTGHFLWVVLRNGVSI